MPYKHVKVPGRRRQDHHQGRQAPGPRSAHRPLHRGRRHRARHLARQRPRARRRGREGLRRQAQDRLDGGLRRREGLQAGSNNWLPDETVEAFREFLVGIKGPLTTPDRRRHPLAERGAAADARPLRLPAPGALVQGRALARQAPREGRHGDLPREHRGHLRRHRVRERQRGREEGPRVPRRTTSPRRTRRSASPRRRRSASSRSRARAPSGWSAPRSSTRSPTSARA